MIPARDVFRPWAPGLDRVERVGRLRTMRAVTISRLSLSSIQRQSISTGSQEARAIIVFAGQLRPAASRRPRFEGAR